MNFLLEEVYKMSHMMKYSKRINWYLDQVNSISMAENRPEKHQYLFGRKLAVLIFLMEWLNMRIAIVGMS